MTRPLILLCNDDGVDVPGIWALADALEPIADWVMVAPHVERSGSSMALSLSSPLRVEQIKPNVYAVEGTPADCVMFAFGKLLTKHKPDWVISGINRGSNIGQDTLYSGTVAAATEGLMQGAAAMAVSLQGRRSFAPEARRTPARSCACSSSAATYLPPRATPSSYNVNIPDVPLTKMRGFVATCLGRRVYDNNIVEAVDPRGRPYFWIGGGEAVQAIPGSDCTLLNEDWIATLTALTPDRLDMAANDALAPALSGVSTQLASLTTTARLRLCQSAKQRRRHAPPSELTFLDAARGRDVDARRLRGDRLQDAGLEP